MRKPSERHAELLDVAAREHEALRVVVELHSPSGTTWPHSYAVCSGCFGTVQGDEPGWPEECETTQAVARALGVEL